MTPSKPVIYLPGLPSFSSDDLETAHQIHESRFHLVKMLRDAGYHIEDIDGSDAWLKNMQQYVSGSDAFLFPPLTLLPESHPRFKAEAAKRWFEFFSLVTGAHIGDKEVFSRDGTRSKPCIIIDPDKQWEPALELLRDLHTKGMFSSKVEDIVRVVSPDAHIRDYHSLNTLAVDALNEVLQTGHGKKRGETIRPLRAGELFVPMRKDMRRHPFGIAVFGSASTKEKSYMDAVEKTAELAGSRGWRMTTGAGNFGCMGAADRGFERGKRAFKLRYPDAPFEPAHVGVSTMPILQLEGPPEHLDQLIITDDIYERMEIMIRGQKSSTPNLRARDATRVLFIAPGGTGTLHELATLLQLATNGGMMKDRKIVLLNFPNHLNPSEGFWGQLITTAKKLGFSDMFEAAHSPGEAIAIADKIYIEWQQARPEHANLPHPVLHPG